MKPSDKYIFFFALGCVFSIVCMFAERNIERFLPQFGVVSVRLPEVP